LIETNVLPLSQAATKPPTYIDHIKENKVGIVWTNVRITINNI